MKKLTDGENRLNDHYGRMHSQEWDRKNFNDYERLENFIQKRNIKKVAELGCGTGWWYQNYGSSMDIDYTGLDISQTAITICKKKFPLADFRNWVMYDDITEEKNYLSKNSQDISDLNCDLLFSRHCFIHNADLRKFLQQCLPISSTIIHMGNYSITAQQETKYKSEGASLSGIGGNYQGLPNPIHILVDNKYSKSDMLKCAQFDGWSCVVENNWIIMEKIK